MELGQESTQDNNTEAMEVLVAEVQMGIVLRLREYLV